MQYCFLNTVYTDENDESIFYEVVLSNKSYTEISLKRVNLQELTEFAESDEYITDFSVKDCYLKCAPVGRYVIDEKIKDIQIIQFLHKKEENFFDLHNKNGVQIKIMCYYTK